MKDDMRSYPVGQNLPIHIAILIFILIHTGTAAAEQPTMDYAGVSLPVPAGYMPVRMQTFGGTTPSRLWVLEAGGGGPEVSVSVINTAAVGDGMEGQEDDVMSALYTDALASGWGDGTGRSVIKNPGEFCGNGSEYGVKGTVKGEWYEYYGCLGYDAARSRIVTAVVRRPGNGEDAAGPGTGAAAEIMSAFAGMRERDAADE